MVAAAGYVGFRTAGHLNLGTTAGAGVVVLAVVTGFSAFFSPCSFPLLLGLLASSDASTARGQTKSDGLRTAAGSVQLGFLKVPFHRLTTLVGPIDSLRVEISSRHRRSSQVLYGFGFVIAGFG